ncbi:cytochrome C [Hylemonella gracilis str. Niagara R]|uniref:Cytochrome C n=1 Tax=Hylemonella gracilis str. Niagara R TaxID=1458275 RepID=A0A016XKC2_9BURK|nr:c-type cytochrome [Hylemonella gracilis]EYC52301.1 cytochrome C [Hylemonella gracilis str. Niagara R]
MKLFAPLMLAAALAAPAFAIAEEAQKAAAPDLAKGEAKFAALCVACHAADGNSAVAANPKLAGQHPQYLLKQLQEFKTGKRDNAIMKGFAAMLSDEDMVNISAWLATQKPKTGFATDQDLVQLGERIYRGGIPDRQIAACAGCHSPNGAGIPAQYPRLSGQHAAYTEAQLNAFRAGAANAKAGGARLNSTPMMQVAAKMNDREIKAVSDYIAGLR